MDIGRVLARSLEIAWRHKVLWVLGFVMALTAGNGGNGLRYNFPLPNAGSPTTPSNAPFSFPQIPSAFVIGLLAFAGCLFLVFLILTLYFRFVARGAMVTFVRSLEQGTAPTLGSAWREGQRYYSRLLGLGFLFNVPLVILTIVVIAVAVIPFVGTIIALISRSGQGQSPPPNFAPLFSGIFAFIGLLCCGVLCLLIVNLILHPIYEFAVRGIVLEESGIWDGLAKGYRRLRLNLGPVALLYLLLIGSRFGWSLVIGVFGLPFSFLLLGGFVIAGSTHSALLAILLAIVIGIPLALVLVFLEGLFQVFEANAWTEGYLALLAPAPSAPPAAPAPVPPPTA